MVLLSCPAHAASIDMQWRDLRWGDVRIGAVDMQADSAAAGWELRLDAISAAGFDIDVLALSCEQGQWQLDAAECRSGVWRLQAGGGALDGRFQWLDGGRHISLNAPHARAVWRAAQGLTVDFEQWPLAGIERLWANETGWPQVSDGLLDGNVRINPDDQSQPWLQADLSIRSLAFDNANGDIAGADVALELSGNLHRASTDDNAQRWRFEGQLGWQAGEMLFGANYLPAPAEQVELQLDGYFEDNEIAGLWLDVSLNDPEAITLDAQASWDNPGLSAWRPRAWQITQLEADIAGVQRRYLNGLLTRLSLDGMQSNGSLKLSGRYGEALSEPVRPDQALTLVLDNVGLNDAKNRFAVSGLHGEMTWHRDWPTAGGAPDSALGWETLQIYRLPFEPAELQFAAGADNFTLQPGTRIGFLGAGLVLHQLAVENLRGGSPSVEMDAEILPVALRDLTQILEWPSFGGQLAGRIPGIDLNNGVWTLDGQLALDLFGGQVVLSSLSAERPFGVLPTFNASVWIDRVQLEPLTEAFAIGRITGPVDGQVNDLRLLGWQPVQFDAWLRTSDRPDTSRRISQRAVDTISSIGGGVGGGLQSTFLRLFEDFGYKKLGFSCRLQKGVCDLDGIAEAPDGQGFLLVQGSGVPSLNVVGHNRRVAWRRMLEQLKAATKSSGPSIN